MLNLNEIIACTLGVDVNDSYEGTYINTNLSDEYDYDELERLLKDF